MNARTIAGDIRRIRSLMRLGPDIGSCVICKEDYGEFLKLLDAIETKAKRMQNALKPALDVYLSQDDKTLDVYDSRLDADVSVRAVRDAKRIYKGGAK